MLRKEIIDYVGKYSFIDNVIRRGVIVFIYYTIDGKQKSKHLPLRSTTNQLQTIINAIKKEIGGTEYGRTKVGKYYII